MIARALSQITRVLSLTLLAALLTSLMMYSAPGYFSEANELDAQHAGAARTSARTNRQEASLSSLLKTQVVSWAHGDLGQSRQFSVPVELLLRDKWRHSATLLLSGLALGWSTALAAAIPLSMLRTRGLDITLALGTALLLAIPVGALATLSVMTGLGSPALVLGLLVAVRDFKLLYRMLQETWSAPFLLHARAQGLSARRILLAHVRVSLHADLLAMLAVSFTLCLSALVPVEVVFDRVGLGQLAWNAAMNRDLPVLVAITALMAFCLGVVGAVGGSPLQVKRDTCV